MALPYQRVDMGTFTSAASVAKHDVVLPGGQPDKFVLRNRTDWGAGGGETALESYWFKGMAQDSMRSLDQAAGGVVSAIAAQTSGGFRLIDTANPPTFSALATTAISAANPAVCSMASTGSIAVGDVVRITDSTGALQIGGYDFEVTALTTNVSATLNLDASAFAAAATAGNVRLIMPGKFYPRWRYIMPVGGALGITAANPCVVSMTVAHDFTVGERVSFRVPSAYGMSEIDGKTGTVTAVTTYTVTVDIDASGFTAFAPPTSAVYAAGVSPAIILPAGSGIIPGANPPAMNINAAYDNRNQYVMRCGTNAITSASAVYEWEAYYSDKFTAE